MQTAIVLAAGQGTRMKSALPKVLHHLCGRPMLDWVLEAAFGAGADDAIAVVGHERERVAAHLAKTYGDRVRTAVQAEQNGTGHAVMCALPELRADAERVLILYGDTPLLRPDDLRALIAALGDASGSELGMLTCRVPDPTGYGRVLRQHGAIVGVREHRDCDATERLIDEINPGMYVARTAFLREALDGLKPNNDQGELYLTDVVALAAQNGDVIGQSADADTLEGINDRTQLAALEQRMYLRIADVWRRAGATIRSTARIDAGVLIEPDARIEHHAVLRGSTRIGAEAVVDVGCVLEDVTVERAAHLKPYSVAQASRIGPRAEVGPFSNLRPDTVLEEEAKVGNFVETKKTLLRRGAKANHLAYLGDGDIGEDANVGAGTIFCNYDGFQKHKTVLGRGAFIGSDSQLVAPVTIGEGAYVATGTTVTKDVPPHALAIARARQQNKDGYATRLKARLAAQKKKPKESDG